MRNSWYVYFGPKTCGNSGGVAMSVNGCVIFGTYYDHGNYTTVYLDNAPYDSQFTAYPSYGWLIVDSFSDNCGNRLSGGALLWPG